MMETKPRQEIIEPPPLDVASAAATPRPAWHRRGVYVLALIVAMHVLVNVWLLPIAFINDRFRQYALIPLGSVMMQTQLFAGWFAFSTWSWLPRLTSSVTCFAIVMLAASVPALLRAEPGFRFEQMILVYGPVSGGLFLVAALTLLAFRFSFRWRICRVGRERTPTPDVQFGIRYLLVWVAVVALILSASRPLSSARFDLPGPLDIGSFALDVSKVAAVMATTLVPVVALTFVCLREGSCARIVLVAIVVTWPLSLFGAAQSIRYFFGRGPSISVERDVGLIQVGAAIAGIGTALALRLAGFRLVRLPRNG